MDHAAKQILYMPIYYIVPHRNHTTYLVIIDKRKKKIEIRVPSMNLIITIQKWRMWSVPNPKTNVSPLIFAFSAQDKKIKGIILESVLCLSRRGKKNKRTISIYTWNAWNNTMLAALSRPESCQRGSVKCGVYLI